MVIHINGKSYVIKSKSLTYEDIEKLTHTVGPTVTCRPRSGEAFTVTRATFLAVTDGMAITAVPTGAA